MVHLYRIVRGLDGVLVPVLLVLLVLIRAGAVGHARLGYRVLGSVLLRV